MTILSTRAGVQTANWSPAKPLYGELIDLWLPASTSQCATGGSRTFNGSTQQFNLASNAVHNLGVGDFVLSGSVYCDALAQRGIVQKWQDADNYWKLEIDVAYKFHFIAVAGGVTVIEVQGTTALAVNTWYQYALVVDRSSAANTKIFRNGVDDTAGTPTVGVTDIDNTGAISVGAVTP